ncbi:hypothetical protein A3Q56_01096 [Intoshia linei]|uniref:Uncharacterized protein n=1 Tax=Intoshia linei TaxID=1819745 RepID=A0A177BA01_9BILA|nr:hypothetical protein A3Q56_01096 [Intoshia linei]
MKLFHHQNCQNYNYKNLKLVPWNNMDEWSITSYNLLSHNDDLIKKSLKQLLMWQAKVCNIPVGMVCTIELFSSYLLYTEEFDSTNFILSASMAVARFVNLVTEKMYDTRRENSKPIHVLARMCNIENWIVDIRHSSSHGRLPSPACLKEAIKYAIDYLIENYWQSECTFYLNLKCNPEILKEFYKMYTNIKYSDNEIALIKLGGEIENSILICSDALHLLSETFFQTTEAEKFYNIISDIYENDTPIPLEVEIHVNEMKELISIFSKYIRRYNLTLILIKYHINHIISRKISFKIVCAFTMAAKEDEKMELNVTFLQNESNIGSKLYKFLIKLLKYNEQKSELIMQPPTNKWISTENWDINWCYYPIGYEFSENDSIHQFINQTQIPNYEPNIDMHSSINRDIKLL